MEHLEAKQANSSHLLEALLLPTSTEEEFTKKFFEAIGFNDEVDGDVTMREADQPVAAEDLGVVDERVTFYQNLTSRPDWAAQEVCC